MNKLNFPISTIKKYNNGSIISKTALDSEVNNLVKTSYDDGINLGFDYYLNPRNTISFESGIHNLFFDKDDTAINYNFEETLGTTVLDSYKLLETTNTKSTNNYQSLFYISKLNDTDDLHIDFTKYYSKQKGTNSFIKNDVLDRVDYSKNTKDSYKLSAEYDHSINEKSSINLGYGFKHLNNTFFICYQLILV